MSPDNNLTNSTSSNRFGSAGKNGTSGIELQTPRGTRDILPEDYSYYEHFYKKAEDIASYYGFKNIQTPHFENEDLFIRSVGETTDIVEKEMFSLKTKGKDRLVLRPEGTAPVMRAYIEHGMHTLPQPVMLQYKGSFFRYERPQAGRLRELQQFGLEIMGDSSSFAEANVIKVMSLILEEMGVGPIIIKINSRGDKECANTYRRELINYYKRKIDQACPDCQRRFKNNPLRLLDCKEEICQKIKEDAPQILNYLCGSCKQHFREVLEYLDLNEIPYVLDNNLVRGLDYYTRTVFEFFEDRTEKEIKTTEQMEKEKTSPLDTNDTTGATEITENVIEEKKIEYEETMPLIALGGGGRYDGLSKILSKREIPAIGGSIGVDRVIMLMKDKKIKIRPDRKPKVFFIQLGVAAKLKSLMIMEELRKAHIPVAQSISKNNISAQMQIADKMDVPYTLILGQKEILENTIMIRNMKTRAQESAPLDNFVNILKKKLL